MNSPSASASATPYDQFEFSAAISRHTPALTCQLKTLVMPVRESFRLRF